MKTCKKCKVNIIGSRTFCPLCQNELLPTNRQEEDPFPILPPAEQKYNLILKLLAFSSIIVSVISVFLNHILFTGIGWSIYVIATLICAWISLAIAIYKHKNILKYLLYQSIIITLFALFIDYFTDWQGWSITFVVPIIFTLAMITMYSLSKILHLHAGDYIIYLLFDAIFGIIPIIFIGSDMVKTDIPSFICILTSIVSVTALVIFEGRKMYSELKRRLHV